MEERISALAKNKLYPYVVPFHGAFYVNSKGDEVPEVMFKPELYDANNREDVAMRDPDVYGYLEALTKAIEMGEALMLADERMGKIEDFLQKRNQEPK